MRPGIKEVGGWGGLKRAETTRKRTARMKPGTISTGEVPKATKADKVRRGDAQSNERTAAAKRQKSEAESLAQKATKVRQLATVAFLCLTFTISYARNGRPVRTSKGLRCLTAYNY